MLLPALDPLDIDPEPSFDAEPTTRFDRGDWDARTFLVPVDGTVHTPTLTFTMLNETEAGGRREGLYPTVESALELDSDACSAIGRGVTAPVASLVNIALMPLLAILDPAWELQTSPEQLYKRWPAAEWWAGPIPAPEDDAVDDV